MATKPELRERFKRLRNETAPVDRQAWSSRICAHLASFCVSRRIRRVGVFWPLGSETDLRALVHDHPEWIFFFPRVTSTHPPRLIWGPEPLEPGVFGLLEPVHAQHFMPPVQLLVVPGLVFDDDGYRIGYGGGYYDRTLAAMQRLPLRIGVAFELSRMETIHPHPHDIPMDVIVTESGLHYATD